MKGAGFCSLNREVHYIVWSLNWVSGVHIIRWVSTNLYAVGVTKVKEGHLVVQKLPTFFSTENIHVGKYLYTYVVS